MIYSVPYRLRKPKASLNVIIINARLKPLSFSIRDRKAIGLWPSLSGFMWPTCTLHEEHDCIEQLSLIVWRRGGCQ